MRRLRKGILVIAIVFFASLMVCGPAQAEKPIHLKFSIQAPAGGYGPGALVWWADRVNKLTDGRVKIDMYWSGSLAPPKEQLPAVTNNIADFAWVIPLYTPSLTPLWGVCSLPGIHKNAYCAGKAMEELNRIEVMKTELAKQNLVFLCGIPIPSYQLISTKPVRKLEDLKGLKIRAVGLMAQIMKSLGAVPTPITPPETFTAMQRKTIEGAFMSAFAMTAAFKLHEVGKYFTKFDQGGLGTILVGNLKMWNNLPNDVRAVFEEVHTELTPMWHYAMQYRGDGEAVRVTLPKAGVEIIELSAEDKATIQAKAAKPLWEGWAENMEKKGLPGKMVLEEWLRISEKWAPLSPFEYVEAKGRPKEP
jgi:TRAP-type C4-dicarboxylate transport system substrate-binding protein